jgi:hypothetical protein
MIVFHKNKHFSFHHVFQFRFASLLDIILLIIGLLAAIGNAAVGPLMMFFLAAMIKTFSGQSTNLCKLNYTDSSNISWMTDSSVTFRQQLHYQSLSLIGLLLRIVKHNVNNI